jgi:tetraacyldisaccharide 4'-kinase
MGLFPSKRISVPVVVVGNITAGGTGKTPLVLWLVEVLAAAGFKPGIISRGYRSSTGRGPIQVTANSPVDGVGDEPLLLARRSSVPVIVGSNRVRAAQAAVALGCDVVISDDGLQHRWLGRDLELLVMDARRGLGNGRMLPAGPLREPANRIDSVDFVITNGGDSGLVMTLAPRRLRRVDNDQPGPDWATLEGPLHGFAGIGNPDRFFSTVAGLTDLEIERHAFADHHAFCLDDFDAVGSSAVIMTEKDAIKCRPFALDNWYYLPVVARLPESLATDIVQRLEGLRQSGS